MQWLARPSSAVTFLVQCFFPEKLKDISSPPPCWGRWGANFPSTTEKLINKAGVKKLLLVVVFTPWRETPTQSIVLPQTVPFTYREEVGCVFLNWPTESRFVLTSSGFTFKLPEVISNCTPGWVSTLWHHFYYRCNVAHATAPGRSEVKVTGSGLLVNQRETDGNITGRSRWSCFDFNDRNWKRISTKQKTKKKSVLSSRHRQPRVQLQSSCGAVGPTTHSQVTALCLVIH